MFFHHYMQLYLYHSLKSTTALRRSRLQHTYCIEVSRQSAQATASKGLAQSPYVVARTGIEPTTLRMIVYNYRSTYPSAFIYRSTYPSEPILFCCLLTLVSLLFNPLTMSMY